MPLSNRPGRVSAESKYAGTTLASVAATAFIGYRFTHPPTGLDAIGIPAVWCGIPAILTR